MVNLQRMVLADEVVRFIAAIDIVPFIRDRKSPIRHYVHSRALMAAAAISERNAADCSQVAVSPTTMFMWLNWVT